VGTEATAIFMWAVGAAWVGIMGSMGVINQTRFPKRMAHCPGRVRRIANLKIADLKAARHRAHSKTLRV
jgi:hypothetical protein